MLACHNRDEPLPRGAMTVAFRTSLRARGDERAVGNGRATVTVTEPVSYSRTVLSVQTVSLSVGTD